MGTSSLFAKFSSEANFNAAFRRVSAKGSVGGIDGISIDLFGKHFSDNIARLREDICSGSYIPCPTKIVAIPKFNDTKEWREICLPIVADKIVQAAMLQVVEPLAERIFRNTSYGYRPGKGHFKAIRRIEHNIRNQKMIWAVRRDIDNFFDSIDHDKLLAAFSDLIGGEIPLMELVALWLRMGLIDKKGRWRNVEAGVRQGHIISPLLANLYLHPLDLFVEKFNVGWVRYADDYLIQGLSREEAEHADSEVLDFLERQCMLCVNDRNEQPISSIDQGFTFLGVYFYGEKRVIAQEKINKIGRKIEWLFSDRNLEPPEKILQHLDRYIQGIRRYYGFLDASEQFVAIDRMIAEKFVTSASKKIKSGQWPKEVPAGLHCSSTVKDEQPSAHVHRLKQLWGEAAKKAFSEQMEMINETTKKKISKVRRRCERESAETGDLSVITPGHFIGKRGERIIVRKEQRIINEVPAIRLAGLTVGMHGVSLSGDVVALCMDKDIPVYFVDSCGRVLAVIRPPGGIPGEVALMQAKEHDTIRGLSLAKMFVLGKVKNQLALLKFYNKYRVERNNGFGSLLAGLMPQMNSIIEQINKLEDYEMPVLYRQKLMGLEGAFAGYYWSNVKQLFHRGVFFDGRKHQDADDLINIALNYGYGVLYSRVLDAVIRAGLNPVSGFLHSFQTGKPVLVFDLIEEFRAIIADRGIFALLRRGEQLVLGQDMHLTIESRKKIANAVISRLSGEVQWYSNRQSIENVIRVQAINIRKHLEGVFNYKPFLWKW